MLKSKPAKFSRYTTAQGLGVIEVQKMQWPPNDFCHEYFFILILFIVEYGIVFRWKKEVFQFSQGGMTLKRGGAWHDMLADNVSICSMWKTNRGRLYRWMEG